MGKYKFKYLDKVKTLDYAGIAEFYSNQTGVIIEEGNGFYLVEFKRGKQVLIPNYQLKLLER